MQSSELILFLGPIGGPEIIMIFIVLFLLAAPILLIFVLVKVLSKPKPPSLPKPPNPGDF